MRDKRRGETSETKMLWKIMFHPPTTKLGDVTQGGIHFLKVSVRLSSHTHTHTHTHTR